MSARKSYIPEDFSGRYLWCENFRQKLSPLREELGIDAEEYARLDTGTEALGRANEAIDRVMAFAHSYTKYRQQLWQDPEPRTIAPPADPTLIAPGINTMSDFEDFLRRFVQQIKNHPNYTEAIGRALGFYGPEIIVDAATAKPVVRCFLSGGRVNLSYDKHRVFSGVRCYVDRGTGDFVLLGTFTRVSFEDPAVLPAAPTRWVYQFQYFIGDKDVGLLSDPSEILVSSTLSK